MFKNHKNVHLSFNNLLCNDFQKEIYLIIENALKR